MNTVVSAMALDYPSDRLTVYLSDDGGSSVTLFAAKEAYRFAKAWVPFCRQYKIATRWPEKYFTDDDEGGGNGEFRKERKKLEVRIIRYVSFSPSHHFVTTYIHE